MKLKSLWRWPPKSTNDKVYFGFVYFLLIVASTFEFFLKIL